MNIFAKKPKGRRVSGRANNPVSTSKVSKDLSIKNSTNKRSSKKDKNVVDELARHPDSQSWAEPLPHTRYEYIPAPKTKDIL